MTYLPPKGTAPTGPGLIQSPVSRWLKKKGGIGRVVSNVVQGAANAFGGGSLDPNANRTMPKLPAQAPVSGPVRPVAPNMDTANGPVYGGAPKPLMSVKPPNPATTSVKPALASPAPVSSVRTPTQQMKAAAVNPATPQPPAGSYGGTLAADDPAAIGGALMNQQKPVTPAASENAPVAPTVATGNAPDQLKAVRDNYLKTFDQSPEEKAAQDQLDAIANRESMLQANATAGQANVADQPIAMGLVTGQQASIQRQLQAMLGQESAKAVPLSAKLAAYQKANETRQKRAETELGFKNSDITREDAQKKAEYERNKPTQVGAGSNLVGPDGKVIYQAPFAPKAEPQPTATIQEYEYAKQNGYKGSFSQYQNEDANRKNASSGGYGGGSIDPSQLSPLARSVYESPAILSTLTPTDRGKIVNELARAGMDVSRFGLADPSAGQRDNITKYDDLERVSNNALAMVDKVNTGPLAGPWNQGLQVIGQASPDFTNYRSAVSDMNSVLLNLRSGSAVSPSEYERIKGFIPLINEDEKTAKQKIVQFQQAINEAKQNYITRSTQSAFQISQGNQAPSAQGTAGTTPSGISYVVIP